MMESLGCTSECKRSASIMIVLINNSSFANVQAPNNAPDAVSADCNRLHRGICLMWFYMHVRLRTLELTPHICSQRFQEIIAEKVTQRNISRKGAMICWQILIIRMSTPGTSTLQV